MAATDSNKPISFEEFRRYQKGEMSFEEQHQFEKLMLKDPMAADAYKGFLLMTADQDDSEKVSLELSQALKQRVSTQYRKKIPIWTYAAAASVVVSLGAYWLVFLSDKNEYKVGSVSDKIINEAPKIAPKTDLGSEIQPKPAPSIQPKSAPSRPATTSQPPVAEPAVVADKSASDSKKSTQYKPGQAISEDEIEERVAVAESVPSVLPAPSAPLQILGNQATAKVRPDTDHSNFVTAKSMVQGSSYAAAPPPVPKIGWNAYQAYLHQNTFSQTNADVVVFFTINSDGSLSDFSATGNETLRAKAIQIIKEGPAWQPVLRNGAEVNVPMHVRLKFHSK